MSRDCFVLMRGKSLALGNVVVLILLISLTSVECPTEVDLSGRWHAIRSAAL
jgi:hypothetical protein